MAGSRVKALMFCALAVVTGCSRSRPPQQSPAAAPPPATPEVDAGLQGAVPAGQLYDDYRTNEVAAERKYNGHSFLVSGKVVEVQKLFGAPLLELQGIDDLGQPSDLFVVNVFMTKNDLDVAAGISYGDQVVVRCDRSERLGSPFLSNCTFESPRPSAQRSDLPVQ